MSAVCAQKSDVVTTVDGKALTLNFFGHGSIGFEYEGKYVYVDPVGDFADYGALPKADLILVGHEHSDHLDPAAIAALRREGTVVVGNATAAEALGDGDDGCIMLGYNDIRDMGYVTIEAVPAYNTSPAQLNFHPAQRKHNGYVLTFGGTRVYVAGDTEPTPEMLALRDIDIAFLPVNQPYTMTESQAAEAIRVLAHNRVDRTGTMVFYPYHYGQVEHKTDLALLARLLENSGVEMRVRPLE